MEWRKVRGVILPLDQAPAPFCPPLGNRYVRLSSEHFRIFTKIRFLAFLFFFLRCRLPELDVSLDVS